MSHTNRREFIKQSTFALAATGIAPYINIPAPADQQLCFSTLGCPEWSFDKILAFAVEHKYQAIEIRTIQKVIDISKIPEFAPANIAGTKRKLADNKIKLVDLGSSAAMHHTDPATRKKNIDEGKAYVDLAAKLGCPYVRIFPNNLPTDDSRTKILDLIVSGLNELGTYAKGTGVKVLMESHGDLVSKKELVYVLERTDNKNVALIWDIVNAWSITKEPPADIYPAIKKYIHHVHVKDGILKDGKVQYTLLGKGEAPVREAVSLLQKGGYKGFYSFEWEKLWHPEIEEPEIALAHYPTEIKKYFK